jgi:hypothetical protein
VSPLTISLELNPNGDYNIAKNPISHPNTKHIEIRCHVLRDAKEIKIVKIDTSDQISDVLTKALDESKLKN